MTDELTREEKATLLGIMDGKNKDDYDREFYETMHQVRPPAPEEVDDRVCRAIFRYISEGTGPASYEENGGLVMIGFIHGYMVGRKLKRDIRRK